MSTFKRYGTGLAIALFLLTAAHPAAGKYYRTDQAVPDVLIYADPAVEENGACPLAVIVDKKRQQVSLYRYAGRWRSMAQWSCSTGKIQGRKEIEGDKKTPEGLYFVTRDVGGRYLAETYGSRALPLDYPNWTDRRQHRSGSAIWLHGTNKPLKAYDSNGCVVMENDAISKLARYMQPRQTPVIIVDRLERTSAKALRSVSRSILSALDHWCHNLDNGSYDAFKQCYAPKAEPAMTWWRQWCGQRRKYAIGAGHRSIICQRAVFREGENFVALFDHYLAVGSHRVWAGQRKLYLQVEGNRVDIIGGSYQARAVKGRDPLFYAWKKLWTIDQRDRSLLAGKKRGSET